MKNIINMKIKTYLMIYSYFFSHDNYALHKLFIYFDNKSQLR